MKTPEEIVNQALARGTPRSYVYHQGAIALLRFKIDGIHIQFPFRMGTVEADAFFAGIDRGHLLWRELQDAGEATR